MLIQKILIFVLTTIPFSLLKGSQVSFSQDYMQAKRELKLACEQADIEQILPLAAFFHKNPLVTKEEKETYEKILNQENTEGYWSKKKKLGMLQVGVSATSFLLSYLCWTSHGNSSLRDSSNSYNPQLKESLNQLSYDCNHLNFGAAADQTAIYTELYTKKSYEKASYYGQKSAYGLGTIGLFSSGVFCGYKGLSHLLAPDNRKKPEIKDECLKVIKNLPCRES